MRSVRALCLLAAGGLLLTGCVKRTLFIDSEPSGAKVWINETPAGVTPVRYSFITHGRYRFVLRKNGFKEVIARERVQAPVYEWIPLDFVAENVLPVRLNERHRFLYKLVPEPPAEHLMEETEQDVKKELDALHDPDPEKRRKACVDLARRRDSSSAESAFAATRDPAPIVRKFALQALRAIRGKEALPRLTEMLAEDPSPEVRWQAAVELEALKDKQAVPALIKALKDRNPVVRAGAAEALKSMPDPRALHPLIASLREKDTTARRAAAETLGKIGDRAAVKPLIRVLSYHDFQARRRAAKSLGQIGDPSASAALARMMDNWDPKVRQIAREAIVQMGDTRPVPLLIGYLHAWHSATRREAAMTLGGLKDPRAVKPLRRAFLRESTYSASQAMLEALKSLGAEIEPGWEQLDVERARRAEEIQKKQWEERKEKDPRLKVEY